MDSGFQGGNDDSYNVYDKPWRKDSGVGNSIYRPRDKQQEQYNDEEVEQMKKARKYVLYFGLIIILKIIGLKNFLQLIVL